MLKQRNLPTNLWGEAVTAAVYILNRSPTRALNDCTPYKGLFGMRPFVDHLRTFGCLAYVLIAPLHRAKFDPKSEKHVFIGYSGESKGYKLLNPLNGNVVVSREVPFHEGKSWGNWNRTKVSS